MVSTRRRGITKMRGKEAKSFSEKRAKEKYKGTFKRVWGGEVKSKGMKHHGSKLRRMEVVYLMCTKRCSEPVLLATQMLMELDDA